MAKSKQQELLEALLSKLNSLEQQNLTLAAKVEELQTVPSSTLASGRGKPRPGVFYVIKGIPQEGSIQPQAIKCMAYLWEAAQSKDDHKLSEAEAMKILRDNQADISRRQDAWTRVFCFYQKRLREMGLVRKIGS